MRDVGGEAHRVAAFPSQLVFQQMAGGAGDLYPPQPGLVPGDQIRSGGVGGDPAGAGVRHSHRDRVEAHGDLDAQERRDAAHRGGEPHPLQVGFWAAQQQERGAGAVVEHMQAEHRLLVVLPVVLNEDHGWSAGAVVKQLVHIEGHDEPVLEGAQQVLAGKADRPARVDDTCQRLHQHGPTQLGQIVSDLVQRTRVEHRWRPPRRIRQVASPKMKPRLSRSISVVRPSAPRRGSRRGGGPAVVRVRRTVSVPVLCRAAVWFCPGRLRFCPSRPLRWSCWSW